MSKSSKSNTTSKLILILGTVILVVGIAILINLMFFKPSVVEAPSEEAQIDVQDNVPDQPLDGQDVQQEEQLEKSTIE